MKKVTVIIICVLLILCVHATALAGAEHTFTIMDTDLKVTIPEGFDTLTRDLEQHKTLLEEHGLDKDELLLIMRNENRYLEAYNRATKNEIMVTSKMDKNSINLWSYSQKNAEAIVKTADSIERSSQDGLRVDYYNTPGGYQFMRYEYGVDEMPEAVIYATVENGRNIEIAAYTYNGDYLQQADLDALEQVVQSFDVLTMYTSPRNVSVEAWQIILIVAIIVAFVLLLLVLQKSHKREPVAQQNNARMVDSPLKEGVKYELLDGREYPSQPRQVVVEPQATHMTAGMMNVDRHDSTADTETTQPQEADAAGVVEAGDMVDAVDTAEAAPEAGDTKVVHREKPGKGDSE